MRLGIRLFSFVVSVWFFFVAGLFAQQGNSGSIEGIVKDPSGATVVNATVEINYPVSGVDSMGRRNTSFEV